MHNAYSKTLFNICQGQCFCDVNEENLKWGPSPPYQISFNPTNLFKSFTHLRSLNIHFEMVEAMGLSSIQSRSSSMSSPPYKISSKSINRFKSYKGFLLCTHLRSLNISHFGMAEATGLKMWRHGHLQ
jgi:hypothetical protein